MPKKKPLEERVAQIIQPYARKALAKSEDKSWDLPEQLRLSPHYPLKQELHFWGFDTGFINKYYPIVPHQFITCRLNMKTINYQKLQKTMENLKYSWLHDAKIVLEAYSKDMTPNVHCHILMVPPGPTSIIKRDLSRKFKIPEPSVDYKASDDTDVYRTRTDYVLGIKTDKKLDACNADAEFFDKRGIQRRYTYQDGSCVGPL